ncbi:MAG: hypothetical protein MRY49_02885 [Candidatus Pacebacteria bacterium]|nr:hypothetical protein [Candidatus Paceibacterota bacterium]
MSGKKEFEQNESTKLRSRGYSIKEIAKKLNVSQGSVSLWVRNLKLSSNAKKRIEKKREISRIKAANTHRNRKKERLLASRKRAIDTINSVGSNLGTKKLICSLVYWCEGSKADTSVAFTNADPDLVSTFLRLLRESFDIDEKKFRVCAHLHGYHDKGKQIEYWSRVTDIPIDQFSKPYIKKNNRKVIRKNYQGCVNIRYYSAQVAQDLLALARVYMGGSIG